MNKKETSSDKIFEKASKIAKHYGFKPYDSIIKGYKKEDKKIKKISIKNFKEDHLKDISSLLHLYFERKLHLKEEPVFLYHSTCEDMPLNKASKKESDRFSLTIIGVEDAFAEAKLLSCIDTILKSTKITNYKIRINSMGDKLSSTKYFNQLHQTIKKNIDLVSVECSKLCRESIKDAHKLLYSMDHKDMHEHLPASLQFLSENARNHFEKVIEYLDANKIEYELANDMVEETNNGLYTVFEIETPHKNIKITGGRYNSVANTHYRRNASVISTTITFNNKIDNKKEIKKDTVKNKNILLYFGENARIKSLSLLSDFYDSKIKTDHKLHKKQLIDQKEGLDEKKYKTIIMLGEEEIENGTIRVRDTKTRAVEVIDIKDSFDTLKKHLQR